MSDRMRLLFTASPAYGHVLPLLPMVRAAMAAGHDVRLATGPDMVGPMRARSVPAYGVGPTWGEIVAERDEEARRSQAEDVDSQRLVSASVLFGRAADRPERRKYVLLLAALVAAVGLVAMASAQSREAGAAAFILYTAGSSVFAALHSGLSFQLLPDPRHRGRDLGLFNLTNTLPSLLGAMLAWVFATPQDFDTVLLVLALITMSGGLAILGVRTWR